jgi:hypothetical protein
MYVQWSPENQVLKHSSKEIAVASSPTTHLAMALGFTKVTCTITQVSKISSTFKYDTTLVTSVSPIPVSPALHMRSTRIKANSAPSPAARSGPRPIPSSTVPFRRDPDFVDRDILPEIHQRCSKPASRVALVGLGGVG